MSVSLGSLLRLENYQYGIIIYEVVEINAICSCGDSDGVTLEIVQDNNVGWEQNYGYHEPNERVGILSKSCMKKLEQELKDVRGFIVIPDEQAKIIKERIVKEEE